ncbi:hypothetical protein [Streptomyces sp. NPDC001675]
MEVPHLLALAGLARGAEVPAVIAFARRRADVLWALLRDDRPFTTSSPARTPAAPAARLGH